MIQTFQLHERAAKLVKRGVPILEDDQFERRARLPKAGTWIRLADKRNRTLALGLADLDKNPFCRVVPFKGERDSLPDYEFFYERAKEARDFRESIFRNQTTDVYRLINAEGDGIPGLLIDKYHDYGVAWVMTPGIRTITRMVYQAVIELFSLRGIYEKGPPREGYHPGQEKKDRVFTGDAAPDVVIVNEGDMRLEARINEGPRTGVYPDQRENRALLAPIVKDCRVLNTFSYTGAFSVHAALAGAAATVSVDLSRRSLEWSKRNFHLNRIDLDDHLHVKADVFDYLKLARKREFSFGLIILDPPTFSTSRKGTFKASRDWPRLLRDSLEILEPDGWLACSCNTRTLSEARMRRFLKEAALKNGRTIQVKEVGGLPPDFPIHFRLDRMDYLKFVLARLK